MRSQAAPKQKSAPHTAFTRGATTRHAKTRPFHSRVCGAPSPHTVGTLGVAHSFALAVFALTKAAGGSAVMYASACPLARPARAARCAGSPVLRCRLACPQVDTSEEAADAGLQAHAERPARGGERRSLRQRHHEVARGHLRVCGHVASTHARPRRCSSIAHRPVTSPA